MSKFPVAKLYHLSSSASDHCPLALNFVRKKKKRRYHRPFKFESMWLKNDKCEEVVHKAWDEGLLRDSAFPLNSCLESCRVSLDAWNQNDFGHVGKQIARLQKTLEWLELQPTSPSIITEMQKTRVELNCWLEKDDVMWLQRSRINWFREGDRNTRYFHSKASARYQNNLIDGMEDSIGVWHEDIGIVEGIIVDYYSALFSSFNPTDFMELLDALEPKVTGAMNQMLLRDFQESEVKTALKQMYPLKAPGLDGMPPLFFLHFWPLIGNVVTKTVLDFLNFGIIPLNFNDTYIV